MLKNKFSFIASESYSDIGFAENSSSFASGLNPDRFAGRLIFCPSGYKTHKSLDEFCEKYSLRVGEPYLIYTKDLRKDGAVTCLPVYMKPL